MEFYRYLFAPILVAVAVWSGHRERHPVPPPEPPAAVVPAVMVAPSPPRAAIRPDPSRPGLAPASASASAPVRARNAR